MTDVNALRYQLAAEQVDLTPERLEGSCCERSKILHGLTISKLLEPFSCK